MTEFLSHTGDITYLSPIHSEFVHGCYPISLYVSFKQLLEIVGRSHCCFMHPGESTVKLYGLRKGENLWINFLRYHFS